MHKKKAGKLQTGSTIPKQYWLAVNGKPKTHKRYRSKDQYITHVNDFSKRGVLFTLNNFSYWSLYFAVFSTSTKIITNFLTLYTGVFSYRNPLTLASLLSRSVVQLHIVTYFHIFGVTSSYEIRR